MARIHDSFLAVYENEHAITMRVLRAFPPEKADFRPHPTSRTARELAWIFVQERGLGKMVLSEKFGVPGTPSVATPPPADWGEILAALEKLHAEFADLVRSYSEDELRQPVKFMIGPKQVGDWRRIDFAWFLLHDQIHHRGQLSVYLRMTGAKVPSIYGPSADEKWM
jgi:uncharacterized damage-inducible protein DinB